MHYDDDGYADAYEDFLWDWREDDFGDMSRGLCEFCKYNGSPHEKECEPFVKWNKTDGAYCLRYFPKDGKTICDTCIHPEGDDSFCGNGLTYLDKDDGWWCFNYEHRRF